MNTSGTTVASNWHWRFTWNQVPEELPQRIREMLAGANRSCTDGLSAA